MRIRCLLAVKVAIVGCVGVANGMTWNAATDFSFDQNPNGPWSSGLQATLADPLTLYDFPDLFTERLKWCRSFSIGDACCPGLGQVTDGGYDFVFPEDKIIAHPGPGTDGGMPGNDVKGEYSTLRWTAPADGLYDVTAIFEGLNSTATLAKVTTADVHVRIDGVSAFSGIINGYIGGIPTDLPPEGAIPTQFWRQIVDLDAGDTVDFAVGDGEDLSHNSDVTGITAIISLFEPPLIGDVNMDDSVDAADYVILRDTGGTPEQFDDWRAHFGLSVPPAASATASAVPEPATSLLLGVIGVALAACRARFR